jgi:hypothetical protein
MCYKRRTGNGPRPPNEPTTMRLDRDTIARLHFFLPRQHPELFAALHRVVEEALDNLKDIGELPPDLDLYLVRLDIDVGPTEEIAARKKDAAAFHQTLRQLLEAASPETSIEF